MMRKTADYFISTQKEYLYGRYCYADDAVKEVLLMLIPNGPEFFENNHFRIYR